MFRTLRLKFSLCLYTRAKCPFRPQLLQSFPNAGHLRVGFQFGALQNLHGFALINLFFSLVSNLSILCIGSSLISFPRCGISASGVMFFRFFFRMYSV